MKQVSWFGVGVCGLLFVPGLIATGQLEELFLGDNVLQVGTFITLVAEGKIATADIRRWFFDRLDDNALDYLERELLENIACFKDVNTHKQTKQEYAIGSTIVSVGNPLSALAFCGCSILACINAGKRWTAHIFGQHALSEHFKSAEQGFWQAEKWYWGAALGCFAGVLVTYKGKRLLESWTREHVRTRLRKIWEVVAAEKKRREDKKYAQGRSWYNNDGQHY